LVKIKNYKLQTFSLQIISLKKLIHQHKTSKLFSDQKCFTAMFVFLDIELILIFKVKNLNVQSPKSEVMKDIFTWFFIFAE